jgi:hypothetical protein
MRIAVVLLLVGLTVGSAGAAPAPAEPCKDLKQAQARTVLGQSAKLAEKQVVRQRVCTVKAGGSVALTVRSDSATDFDWVVAGLKENPAYVKQLKAVSLGDKGYSYDRYALVGGKSTFTLRVLFFKAGARIYSVEVPARRLLTPAKHLTIARSVVSGARKSG